MILNKLLALLGKKKNTEDKDSTDGTFLQNTTEETAFAREFGPLPEEKVLQQPEGIKTGYTRNELLGMVHDGQLVLPEGMAEVRDGMFDGCKQLESVVVPGSVKRIGRRAFAKCPNLKSVLLLPGIEAVESNAFTDCTQLKSIQLPPSIQKIDGRAFYRSGLNEPVFSANGKVLVYYPQEWKRTEYTVPEGVEEIASRAFLDAEHLTQLHLNAGLKRIERNAFVACGFREIEIPSGVRIACGAFSFFSHELEIRCKDELTPLEKRMEHCRCLGRPFLRCQRVLLPQELYWKEEAFRVLAQRCSQGEVAAMDEMCGFFAGKPADELENTFYKCAEQFWRVRAYRYGSETAKGWLENWLKVHPDGIMISPALDENLCGSSYGRLLNALGFLFFEEEEEYSLSGLDEDGVVEVTSYESEDGPDEDGFGREVYYDWWYLDEMLNLPQGAGYLHSYSLLDRRNNQKVFHELHERAAALSRQNHP